MYDIEAIEKRIAEIEAEGDNYIENLRSSIESQLTDYDRKWIDAWWQFNAMTTQYLNDTTMDIYGIKKATVENYFPLITDKNFQNVPFEDIARDIHSVYSFQQ